MVRKFIGVAAVFAFVAAFIVSGPAEAGDFADLVLLLDVSIDADSTNAAKINQGDTTLTVPAVGDTVRFEVFLKDAGGLATFTYNLAFDNTGNAFADGDEAGGDPTDPDTDDTFMILEQDGIVGTFGGAMVAVAGQGPRKLAHLRLVADREDGFVPTRVARKVVHDVAEAAEREVRARLHGPRHAPLSGGQLGGLHGPHERRAPDPPRGDRSVVGEEPPGAARLGPPLFREVA